MIPTCHESEAQHAQEEGLTLAERRATPMLSFGGPVCCQPDGPFRISRAEPYPFLMGPIGGDWTLVLMIPVYRPEPCRSLPPMMPMRAFHLQKPRGAWCREPTLQSIILDHRILDDQCRCPPSRWCWGQIARMTLAWPPFASCHATMRCLGDDARRRTRPFAGVRIGEASHPGPPERSDVSDVAFLAAAAELGPPTPGPVSADCFLSAVHRLGPDELRGADADDYASVPSDLGGDLTPRVQFPEWDPRHRAGTPDPL